MPETLPTPAETTQQLIAANGPVQTIRQMTDQLMDYAKREIAVDPNADRTDGHSWHTRVNPNGVACSRCGQFLKLTPGVQLNAPDWGCKGRKGD